jgi:hypothetical protein
VTGTVTYSIDGAGIVTATGTAGNPSLNGAMNAAKELIIATATTQGTTTAYGLQVFRKRLPGVNYSGADVANLAFAFQSLQTGGTTAWGRGAGTTDGAGAMTLSSLSSPAGEGTLPAPGFDTMSIDADGLVTQAVDTSFHGFMTADKAVIFGVKTITTGQYALSVRLVTGGSFSQADLAGAWRFRMLASGTTSSSSSWLRATSTIDATGAVTYAGAANPMGAVGIAAHTLALGADGSITNPGAASYLGQLALGGDLFVRTTTASDPTSVMSISVR